MSRERDDRGRFTEFYGQDTFLAALNKLEVPSTSNVSEYVGCSYNLAYRRLKRLEQEGRIRHEAVGGSFLWFIEDDS